jgi:hypothetical protein
MIPGLRLRWFAPGCTALILSSLPQPSSRATLLAPSAVTLMAGSARRQYLRGGISELRVRLLSRAVPFTVPQLETADLRRKHVCLYA